MPQPLEPVKGQAVERKGQAALRSLERQDEDDDHRPVEEQDEQREKGGEPVESGGTALIHDQSSLRTSTMRLRPTMISKVTARRITALAAAGGNCSAFSRVSTTLPAEAICSPPITPKVMKSPITIVTTKIEPITMPGLHRGTIRLHRVCQAVAPES